LVYTVEKVAINDALPLKVA